jgi:predicted lipoprotein with Yx(FWY)xxD motif
MKKVFGLSMVALILAAFVVTGVASADHHAVKVAKRDGAASYLTDLKGMTLYTFKKDTPGKSACEGACVDNWP